MKFMKSAIEKLFSGTYLRKSLAFTLAETLIVMGVIGVVAALTIPLMSRDINNVEKVAKFKKLYNEISNAHEQAVVAYGPVDEWFKSSDNYWVRAQKYINRLSEFLKVTKIWGERSGPFPSLAVSNTSYLDHASADLQSGASISTKIESTSCDGLYYISSYTNTKQIRCGRILLDIDGAKRGKNTFGIDLFVLAITKEGIKPAFCSSAFFNTDSNELASRCTHGNLGSVACGQWIMDNDNMDYLLAKDRSTYDKSRTCPNGKKLGYNANLGEVRSCK
ncbi:type II secretion system protein [bacterium]|nr:type II secretion system protein [bacterium]